MFNALLSTNSGNKIEEINLFKFKNKLYIHNKDFEIKINFLR